jgi:hypothetical protein
VCTFLRHIHPPTLFGLFYTSIVSLLTINATLWYVQSQAPGYSCDFSHHQTWVNKLLILHGSYSEPCLLWVSEDLFSLFVCLFTYLL